MLRDSKSEPQTVAQFVVLPNHLEDVINGAFCAATGDVIKEFEIALLEQFQSKDYSEED